MVALHLVEYVFHLSPKSNTSFQYEEDRKGKHSLWSAPLADNMKSNYNNTGDTTGKGLCGSISKRNKKEGGEIEFT